jgi:hypothetical protein
MAAGLPQTAAQSGGLSAEAWLKEGAQQAGNARGCVAIFIAAWGTGVYQIVMARQGTHRRQPLHSFSTSIVLIFVGIAPISPRLYGFKLEPQRKAFYKDPDDSRGVEAEWSAGVVDQTIETGLVINAMMIFWALASLLFGFFRVCGRATGVWAGLFFLVVPLVLVGFVIAKIRGGMRRRFGKSELALDEMPAHIGETLRRTSSSRSFVRGGCRGRRST